MPVDFGTNFVRLSGGGRIRRYIRRQRDEGPVDAARRFVRLFSMASMRSRVPRDTGLLRRSLKLRQRGPSVRLLGVQYAPFVRFGPFSRRTVSGEARRQAEETLQRF